MKKVLTFFALIFSIALQAQTGIYNISFSDIENKEVKLASYAGKKILVITVDVALPDYQQLRILDSLITGKSESTVVIAIPFTDCGHQNHLTFKENDLKIFLGNEMHSKVILAGASKGKKSAGVNQHTLMTYLTSVQSNKHFNRDLERPGQFFVINEHGELYAIVNNKEGSVNTGLIQILNHQF